MKIKINQLHENQDELLVTFCSPIGNGIALWSGIKPTIGETLYVELDIDETFSWQKNIFLSPANKSLITVINGTVKITAKLIQGTEYKCAALKLDDSIILIELEDPSPQGSEFVQISTRKLYLHPVYM
ncbi:hypothetical protein [Pseudomonas sp. MPB26]|uniref:hypothetical protein n=1 Tax=Pseudomonas sp. MPB26 TaxID=3388491 RepID=UPI003984639A